MADKTDKYWQMYSEVWQFHKKYINGISDSDDFWEELIVETDGIARRYDKCKFIRNLLLNEVDEFERVLKETRNGQK